MDTTTTTTTTATTTATTTNKRRQLVIVLPTQTGDVPHVAGILALDANVDALVVFNDVAVFSTANPDPKPVLDYYAQAGAGSPENPRARKYGVPSNEYYPNPAQKLYSCSGPIHPSLTGDPSNWVAKQSSNTRKNIKELVPNIEAFEVCILF